MAERRRDTEGADPGPHPGGRWGGRFRHEVLAVAFQVRQAQLHVLLWQRAQEPFQGRWALPGGPLGADELLGTSLGRHLAAKVDLTEIGHLEQLETRSDPDRDPREREVATAYLALLSTEARPRLPADTAWHPVDRLPPTGFDHASIIESARERLRSKLSYTSVGFALAPATFSIAELRAVYAATMGHPVDATNLQRVLVRRGVIEATDAVGPSSSAGGRPATLYRFAARTLLVTHPFAAFRPPGVASGLGAPDPDADRQTG
jgi:ADP-ribose pyrophosphatase YjhB (NUDIX family)